MIMTDVFLVLLVFTLSWAVTGISRYYALRCSLLDVPNERSSHTIATPRGGGLGIVVAFLLTLFWLYVTGKLPLTLLLATGVGGSLVAAIGYMDDHRPVKARWRLVVHFLAAGLGVFWLGGFPDIRFGSYIISAGWPLSVAGIVALVWMLNLFNFMDGIDGLAATEAIFIAGGAALISFLSGNGAENVLPCLLLVVSSLGFLLWNFPPARIFLGDVGSGFLGIVLGFLAIFTVSSGHLPLWTWIILSAVFLVDASVTLLQRMIRRERWYEAHRSHAYQRLSRRLHSHLKVVLAVGAVNILWLFPLALVAAFFPPYTFWCLFFAFTPLIWGAMRLGAGLPD